jgi:hypothetical protein
VSLRLVDRFDDTIFAVAPWMIATAHHPDNLFGDVEPKEIGANGLPVRRLLDEQVEGPIADPGGGSAWTTGKLLPVMRFMQRQPAGQTTLWITYLRTRNNGRILRQLTVEWSMAGSVRKEEILPYEAETLGQLEPLLVRFFPSLQLMNAPRLACSGITPLDCIAVINQETNTQTWRTPMAVHFALDDDGLGASKVTSPGQRSRAQLLGPDGRPARR